MRHLLIASVALGTILLYLLALATGNTSKLAEYYWWVFGLNLVVLTGLLSLIGHQIWRLRRKLRERVFGAKLTQKLTIIFTLVALMPGVLVFTISAQFLTRSIESWFDVRVETALDRGLGLGRNALDFVLQDVSRKSRVVLNEIIDDPDFMLPARLERMRDQLGVSEIAVYTIDKRLIGYSSSSPDTFAPVLPMSTDLRRLVLNKPTGSIENLGEHALELRVLTRYRLANDEVRVLVVRQMAPETIVRDAELIETARNEYSQLLLSRDGLKTFYMLTLLMSFLLALTAALAFALFMSERLSAPLSELAAGTRAVAQGDYSKRHPVYRRDELGMLTTLFNRMTQQLDDARRIAEENRRRELAARRYLESVLANLSAGVLAFDGDWLLRAANNSAIEILQVDLDALAERPFSEWALNEPALAALVDIVHKHRQEGANAPWQQQLDYQLDEQALILLARGTPLSDSAVDSGYVIVFDDITELVRAQRDAAWGEVAKRLAHEIRNPLTPIQLSAERLAMKLESKLEGADADMLRRSTDTIIKQATALKGMVDAFRDYARAPRMRMSQLDINQVIREVLTLYEGNPALQVSLADGPLPIMGDAALLRQVLHNLLQNAQDAVVDEAQPMIHISSNRIEQQVEITVVDNGPGFNTDILPRAFEPYVTNKTKGTGLGLAVVKKIVEEHHGTISLYNTKQQGACIQMTLPLLEA